MKIHGLVACTILLFASNLTHAAPISMKGLGETYTPGNSFSFEVSLPEIQNLGAYNIDLLLSSNSGVAGVDYFFDVDATIPAPSMYVFPTSPNFFDAALVDSFSAHRLTLTDFNFSGVEVLSDVNDLVAIVTIGIESSFQGDLMLSFDIDGLFLDTPAILPTSVSEFDDIRTNTEALEPVILTLIPEPSGCVLFAIGAMFFAVQHKQKYFVLHKTQSTF